MNQIRPEETLTTRQVAERLGVSLRTIQLWVESDVLPAWRTPGGHRRIPAAAVDALVAGRVARPAPGHRQTQAPCDVLIVEDDMVQRRLMQRLLLDTFRDVTMRVATNGYEGLIRAGQTVPDLMITDIMMPGMDGLQMLAALRAMPEFSSTGVIVVSGLTLAEVVERGGLPEGVQFLGKPFTREQLLQALTQALPNGGAHLGLLREAVA
jgi:excisionase family DNA binding protein